MKTIYKYELKFTTGVQKIKSFSSFTPLSVKMQGDKLMIWAMVDTNEREKEQAIGIYGTGFEVGPISPIHIDTIIVDGFVWHAFWLT